MEKLEVSSSVEPLATPSVSSASTTDEETGCSDDTPLGALAYSVHSYHCRRHRLQPGLQRDFIASGSSLTNDDSASSASPMLASISSSVHDIPDDASTIRPPTLQVYLDEDKEEVNVVLDNVDRHHGHGDASIHDERLRNGSANHLAEYLHRLILLPRHCFPDGDGVVHISSELNQRSESSQPSHGWPSMTNTSIDRENRPPRCDFASYRTELESTRALQVTAACRALCLIVLGASKAVLEAQLAQEDETILAPSALTRYLLTSLPLVIQLLASPPSDDAEKLQARGRVTDFSSDGDLIASGQFYSTSSWLVRFSGLNSALRIVQRVGPLLMDLPTVSSSKSTVFRLSLLVKALVSLLGITEESSIFRLHRRQNEVKHWLYVPPDIRVEAAIALTSVLPAPVLNSEEPRPNLSPLRELLMSSVSKDLIDTRVITLLSTGARTLKDTHLSDDVSSRCIAGLARLAQWNSRGLARKLLGRRCVVSSLTHHLLMMTTPASPHSGVRKDALPRALSPPDEGYDRTPLDLTRALIMSSDALGTGRTAPSTFSQSTSIHTRSVMQDNIQLLAVTVVRAVLQETREETKIGLLEILVLLIERDLLKTEVGAGLCTSPLVQTAKSVLNVLLFFASSSSGCEHFVVRAAALYLRALQVHETAVIMASAVDLLSSPFPKVREQVFRAIMGMCFWKIDEAKCLLNRSNLIDHLGYALCHGSNSDLENAVKVSKQLVVFHQDTHDAFCGDVKYVSSLVTLVTQEPVRSRLNYGDAVDVLLELMSVPDQIPPFVPHDEKLLPWLVKFTSRTSDEELKRRAGSTIIRYSTILLKKYKCG